MLRLSHYQLLLHLERRPHYENTSSEGRYFVWGDRFVYSMETFRTTVKMKLLFCCTT